LSLRPAPEFEQWLEKMQLLDAKHRLMPVKPGHRMLEKI
jgi:ethanolamine ammonia-lyase large subunit